MMRRSPLHDEHGSNTRPLRNEVFLFADVLTESGIRDALNEHSVQYRYRVFNPVTTIWGLLSQVLSDDQSLPRRRARIIAHRGGQWPGDPATQHGQLLQRPGPRPLRRSARQGRRTAEGVTGGAAAEEWKGNERPGLHRRRVVPLHAGHTREPGELPAKPVRPAAGDQLPHGLASPRCSSLATGACHDLATAPYAGKRTGETTLLRRMYDALSPGDGGGTSPSALFDNYFLACELRGRGIELGRGGVQAERGGDPDGGGPARWRHHPLAAAQQAAGDDRRGVPPLPEGAADAPGDCRGWGACVRDNRAEVFKVITMILDASIDGGQI